LADTTINTRKQIDILLVEDNPGDVRLAQAALNESGVNHRLTVARDGCEALCILRREDSFSEFPIPDVIFLDLNLPKMGGHEVLEEIKNDELLKHIPVVVLSTSSDLRDITRSYKLRANSYISKPADLDDYIETLKSISSYWSGIATLPSR